MLFAFFKKNFDQTIFKDIRQVMDFTQVLRK